MPAKRPSGKRPPPQRRTPDAQPRPAARQGRAAQPQENYVAVGFVRAPHGTGGEIAIDPMTDFPDRFMPGSVLFAGGARYTVAGVRTHQKTLLLALDGIETRNQAETLRNQLLEVPQEELADLDEDAYYRFEIVGLAVVDQDGTALGNVEEVLETGSNDVYVVRDASSETLIPAIDTVVREVDLAAGRMVVDLIAGLERRPLKRK